MCFPEYNGPQTYAAGTRFIKDLFEKKNKQPNKEIYSHVTCATDTNNIRHVFTSVHDTIIKQSLRLAGMI